MNEREGSLLDVTHGLIVHGCNAQGVMGSGVAKAVRDRYPQAFSDYRAAFDAGGLSLGQVVWTVVNPNPASRLAIANGITQRFYGRDPSVRYVDEAAVQTVFETVGAIARTHGLTVHYPKIGAGLGNGDWSRLYPIIQRALEGVDHTLWVPAPPLPKARPKPRGQ